MTAKREKILIVDDEETITELLREKLSRETYHCEEARSAEQALERLRSNQTELVILDIMMPDKSGIDLLSEIRANYPDTAVIMATAVTETDVAIQCMKQGAQDYISKPFNLDEVARSVGKVLEKRRLELKIRKHQQHLEQRVEKQTREIRKLFLSAIEALVFALEAKDKYTAGHSRRVTEIAVAIGKELGLSPNETEDLRWGTLLHDIGKIAIAPLIQNKPSKLTPEEYRHIMMHIQVGARIVRPVVNEKVVEIIEHHHDHYDGSGLHQVVVGEDIPLGARIVTVADAFDAMTSDRSYRLAMSTEETLDEIRRRSGTQFDPVVVTALFKLPMADAMPSFLVERVACQTV